jgi:hypothetical protein
MATLPNATNITPPRVDFLDPRTGKVSREWYMFFLSLFKLTGGGGNNITLEDLQLGPADSAAEALALISSNGDPSPAALPYDFSALVNDAGSAPAQADFMPLAARIAALEIEPVAQPPAPTIAGTYTPTLTGVANVAASTSAVCMYTRLGDIVSVWGRISVTPTLTATSTSLGVSLPLTSALVAADDVAGTVAAAGVAQTGGIEGDVANARAQMRFISNSAISFSMFFSFSYRVF